MLGNFKYRHRRSVYPEEFMLGGIFIFVAGGQCGYTFSRNRFMKKETYFSGWSSSLV